MSAPRSVDEYIGSAPEPVRPMLNDLRDTIRSAARGNRSVDLAVMYCSSPTARAVERRVKTNDAKGGEKAARKP
jgi:hypothetical protein